MASPLAQCRAPGTTGNTQSFPLGGWIWCQDRSTTSCLGLAPPGRIPRPTPVFLPGEFYGQRRLAGYSSWGHKESDTTERLTLSLTSSVLGNLGWSQASFYTVVSQISEDTTSSLSRCTFPLLASPFLPVTPISPSLLFSLNSVSNLSEINCHVLLRL